MHEFRVTKYDPSKRDDVDRYLDKEEWTDFSDVGNSVSLEEYESVERAYIKSAVEFIAGSGITSLKVVGLEDSRRQCQIKEHENISIESLEPVLRALLRGDCWCRLEGEEGFVHIGWDYYMYIGVNRLDGSAIHNTECRGLYVETFVSPYHPENR